MNFKNLSENLIIVIVIMASTAWGTYELTMKASLKANEQTINLLIPALEEAIKKETTKIENNLTNTFEKKALKKADNIQIIIDPTTNSVISNADTNQVIELKEDRGFLKKWFKRKK